MDVEISLNYGIKFLENTLVMMFSEFDCYGTEDFKGVKI